MDLPLPVASIFLRALNARGLLRASRSGRCVHYRVSPDRSVHGAVALIAALADTFANERRPVQVAFHLLTGFTHPRRLTIVQALWHRRLSRPLLRAATGISTDALNRHLAKLLSRGLVSFADGIYSSASPKICLAATLLKLARE